MPVRPSGRYCIEVSLETGHHGIVWLFQRVKVPVGPSGPSRATRTTSREPSSTDSVPAKLLRLVAVNAGETRLTLMSVSSSSTIMARVMALSAVLEAAYPGPYILRYGKSLSALSASEPTPLETL